MRESHQTRPTADTVHSTWLRILCAAHPAQVRVGLAANALGSESKEREPSAGKSAKSSTAWGSQRGAHSTQFTLTKSELSESASAAERVASAASTSLVDRTDRWPVVCQQSNQQAK